MLLNYGLLAIAFWLSVVVVGDLLYRKVWNAWIIFGVGLGVVCLIFGLQPFLLDWEGVGLGLLAVLVLMLPFYMFGWMGGGDVKFGVVLVIWFGFSSDLLLIWLGGSLLAGLHSIVFIIWRKIRFHGSLPMLLAMAGVAPSQNSIDLPLNQKDIAAVSRRDRVKRTIPYAGYLALVALYIAWTESHSVA